ncbi:MAG: hypothetical protein LC799_31005 [Actinobacteria bacterium]|nr:hypothetical protein [Actinomycetota bacterium]
MPTESARDTGTHGLEADEAIAEWVDRVALSRAVRVAAGGHAGGLLSW